MSAQEIEDVRKPCFLYHSRLLLVAVIWELGLFAVGSVARAEDPRVVAKRVHEEGGYTSEIEVRGAFEGTKKSKADEKIRSFFEKLFSGGAPIMKGLSTVVVWVAVALALALIGLILLRLRGGTKPREEEQASPRSEQLRASRHSDTDLADASLDPQVLWEHGKHVEAVQVLVARARQAAGWDLRSPRANETVRETLAALDSDDRRGGPLKLIILEAEPICYGGRPADRDSFTRMCAAYEQLR